MRPSKAKNLQWRDVQSKTHRDGQSFVILSVRGKKNFRNLVATKSVGDYLERVRTISKATDLNDRVFTNWEGGPTVSLFHGALEKLLIESNLLLSTTGKRRSTYCFRHTYATFRLTEGVDVYFLAKQMGTCVLMIEKHYGHINPVKPDGRPFPKPMKSKLRTARMPSLRSQTAKPRGGKPQRSRIKVRTRVRPRVNKGRGSTDIRKSRSRKMPA